MIHKYSIFIIIILFSAFSISCRESDEDSKRMIDPENKNKWSLSWSDEFNYTSREELLKAWIPQNGRPMNPVVLSSFSENNIIVKDGIVQLTASKETRVDNLNWTTASIWTKEDFKYGYFESRYKYAAATATNNSFWLYSLDKTEFEIDVNEGHYPNIINTNIHSWDKSNSQSFRYKEKDFSQEYHLYGLEWTEEELVYYFDRREIRRVKNTGSFSLAKIYLSLAIVSWAGAISDNIDGKYMEVDYVRFYKPVLILN